MSRVLLIDDHPLFRRALRSVVKSALPSLVTSEADSLAKARAILTKDSGFSLILLDLSLPDCQGLKGLLLLQSEFSQVPIAIVSSTSDSGTVGRAMAFGAAGFISKSSSGEEIAVALRSILAGEIVAPPAAYDQPLPEIVESIAHLSPAQLRILLSLQRGLRNKEIAFEMGVTERTVKAYMTTMFRKLHVTTRTQAVIAAQSLLRPDSI